MRRLVVSVLLLGCQGEQVVSADASPIDAEAPDTDVDAATDARIDSPAEAGVCNVSGNLLRNPSFEDATDFAVAGWSANLQPKSGGAYDCARYAEWRNAADFESVTQTEVSLGEEAPAGAVYEFAVWVKTLDGNSSPFNLYTSGATGDYSSVESAAINSEWTHIGMTYTLSKPTPTMTVALRLGGAGKRAFALDLATLVRKK